MAPPTATNVRVRLPKGLAERVRELADEQGVSINTLLATIIAGSVGFDLRHDQEPTEKDSPGGADTPRGQTALEEPHEQQQQP
jgi:hypothetical protein